MITPTNIEAGVVCHTSEIGHQIAKTITSEVTTEPTSVEIREGERPFMCLIRIVDNIVPDIDIMNHKYVQAWINMRAPGTSLEAMDYLEALKYMHMDGESLPFQNITYTLSRKHQRFFTLKHLCLDVHTITEKNAKYFSIYAVLGLAINDTETSDVAINNVLEILDKAAAKFEEVTSG
jgi:hypothetical protein